jgi:hypothetical protein
MEAKEGVSLDGSAPAQVTLDSAQRRNSSRSME